MFRVRIFHDYSTDPVNQEFLKPRYNGEFSLAVKTCDVLCVMQEVSPTLGNEPWDEGFIIHSLRVVYLCAVL